MLIKACESSGVLNAIYILKVITKIIFILVPVIIILTAIISLTKAVISGDDKSISDTVYLFITKIVIGVLVFMIPTVFTAIISLVGNGNVSNNYLDCYKNATKEKIAYFKQIEQNQEQQEKKEKQATQDANAKKYQSKMQEFDKTNYIFGGSTDKLNSSLGTVMYIGDSRTVGMYYSLYGGSGSNIYNTKGNEFWYAKVAMGYNWFVNTAMPQITSRLKNNNYNVIILMGANDLGNANTANSYVKKVSELATTYPNSNYVVVSVNPINDSKASRNGYSVKNSHVIAFNNKLQSAVSSLNKKNVIYCDTYKSIISDYVATDGIHYNSKTNKKIYNLVNGCL